MPISLRRWKQKATKYINDHFRGTGVGTLNHDLKMYLEMPEFRPLFDQSVERINRGANEDAEIETMIRELARSTLTTAIEVAEERGGGGGGGGSGGGGGGGGGGGSESGSESLSPSTTNELQPHDVNVFKGNGIHYHYHYFFH